MCREGPTGLKEVLMGDKSPKSKNRKQKQNQDAKAKEKRAHDAKAAPQVLPGKDKK